MKLLHNPAIRLWLASNVWMFRRRLQPIYVSLLFLALFSDACAGRHAPAALSAPAPQQAQPPALGEKIHISGISDAGKINDFLYRGSQPNQKGIEELKKLGVLAVSLLSALSSPTCIAPATTRGNRLLKIPTSHARQFAPGALLQLLGLGLRPKTVIDVGVASETRELYEAVPDTEFLLIEPLAEFEPFLRKICEKYKAQCVLAAAGEAVGTAT